MSNEKIKPIDTNPVLKAMFKNADINDDSNRKTWEELDEVYQVMAESLVEVGNNVANVSRSLIGVPIKNPEELAVSIKGLSKDLVDITDTLCTIRSRYEGKVGVIKSEEDDLLSKDVFMDYQELAQRQHSLIFQPLLTITEALSELKASQTPEEKKEEVKFTPSGDIEGDVVVVKEE